MVRKGFSITLARAPAWERVVLTGDASQNRVRATFAWHIKKPLFFAGTDTALTRH